MNTQLPQTRDLVLVGGGHTHALVLRSWAMKPLPGVRLTVINPGPTAPYSGMLPGFVAGHYTRDELDIDLVQLGRFAGARVILGAVDHIDVAAKTISVPGRPSIAYDVTAVDVGITSTMPSLKGFTDHAIPAKPLGVFASRWDAFRATAKNPHIAIIGGGVAGAELAMAMAHALRRDGSDAAVVQLVDRGSVLKDLGSVAKGKVLAALETQGVTLIENADVAEIAAHGVILTDGTLIKSDFTTGAAGAKPHDWVAGLDLDIHEGFITVNDKLQSSNPDVFAVGDCAHLSFDPRPKAGVYAVREAPVLFDNLQAHLSGRDLRAYKPQKDYLKLVSLGGKSALAEKFGTARQGPLLWKLKNHIDRTFMNQFDGLNPMALPDVPETVALGVRETLGDKPMCGGCGSKVGRGALRNVLSDLPRTQRDDIQSVAGDDAAILQTGDATQVMSTDHLRAMIDDPVMMTRIAAVHALGDIWAMGAQPQAATATIILPRTSEILQERALAEIMTTAHDVFTDAGAAIVGGHTSQGDALTIGFTVTGLVDGQPITLKGAKKGDALIITKPIGSGVIMAAEMQCKAAGADVAAALQQMVQGQADAAAVLHDAHAMTDVTGFGLAGHLAGICEASGVGADVTLTDVPLMQGARTLAEAGQRSSLFDSNKAGVAGVECTNSALSDLMFDPQTAGGLLAVVDPSQAADVIAKLEQAGYPAAQIGTITDQVGRIILRD
ncbi:selenide, water dikinase SelD [Loktanella sp. F6476L]|uniref:selenide, water dikinase SelD n=1 Tax=Loktanella sp. F6476L TaxID=2926405 RepID=UPI001FF3E3AD|nr:selenide, water dikinase SelD [Loktanella sp. F6476L]MCK0121858.1 selenide, water dikinase SelD [Loktanella sp. F6476L]